ncbi:unnamed protein product [Ectocarpus sp. CCAP 1310/34]|nr:unnamed protein product [Ectocarpus sp. CCAP 1310/34]
MERLGQLRLEDNNLTGAVPTGLANLSALSTLQVGNTRSKAILRRGNKLTGGPAKGEALGAWKDRILRKQQAVKDQQKEAQAPEPPPSTPPRLLPQQQEAGESDQKEENAPMPLGSSTQGEEVMEDRAPSLEHAFLSPRKEQEVDRFFRAQLSSSAGLGSPIRENPESLEDNATHGGTSPAFWSVYYTAVRTGLCEGYLAASVINSDWVSASKTGSIGEVGAAVRARARAAFKLLSSTVPVVGGLPELAGKALEIGDHYLQSRRLVKHRNIDTKLRKGGSLVKSSRSSVATSNTPKEMIVRSPVVVATAHDNGLPSREQIAAMQASSEALKFDRETQQAELEELQAAKDKQQEELKAMRSANKKLQRKVRP